MAPES